MALLGAASGVSATTLLNESFGSGVSASAGATTTVSVPPPVGAIPVHVATATTVPSTTACNGRSYTYVVKVYHRGSGAYSLRCGTSSWGFIHIVAGHGWGASLNAAIASVISQGFYDSGVFNWRRCPNFRVPYNGGAYNGNGVSPQSIITAYYSGASSA
jgi:hypothetical protein